MVRAFAAQAGLFDAAKGHVLGGQDADVDADHAVLQRLADAENAAHVAAVEVAGQAELGGVGGVDRLLLGLEPEHRGKGAKGFFLGAQHVGAGIGDHGWLKKLAGHFAAAHGDPAALCQRVGHMAADLLDRRVFDQRALHHAVLKAVADLQRLDLGRELGQKLVVHAFLHIKAVGADAGLAGVAVLAEHGAFDR